MLQTGNGKGNEDDKGGDEFEGDGSDDYLEDDDNDDDEDDDLVESEYEISDGVSGSGIIPIIEVKDKGKTKKLKLKTYYRRLLECSSNTTEQSIVEQSIVEHDCVKQ